MHEVGFDLSGDGTDSYSYLDRKSAVLALAERLTGVRLTEDLLRHSAYQLGHVPDEPAPEWTSVVIDITDASRERFYKEVTRDQVEHAMGHHSPAPDQPIRLEEA